jgi:hypothetical protein
VTSEEATLIAERKARALNMPWGHDVEVKRLWRLWPFPRMWRVTSVIPSELSQTIIHVNERTKQAFPRQVRVAHRFGSKP